MIYTPQSQFVVVAVGAQPRSHSALEGAEKAASKSKTHDRARVNNKACGGCRFGLGVILRSERNVIKV
jgi:hypothetical protein